MRFRGTIGAAVTAAALFTAQQACAQRAEVGPSPLIRGGSELQPAGDPGSWVTNADYPAEAKAARQTGTVGFVLKVDTAGMVSDCTVIRSSGSRLLDSATCRLLERRARFVPARDADNEPMSATWGNSVTWSLPEAAPEAAKS